MNMSFRTYHVTYILRGFRDLQIKYFGNDLDAAKEFVHQLFESGNPSGRIYWTTWNVVPIDG